MWDMTQWSVTCHTATRLIHRRHDSFICGKTWSSDLWHVTRLDSVICDMYDMSLRLDSVICDMSHERHDSVICDMSHDSFICGKTEWSVTCHTATWTRRIYDDASLIHRWGMTHSYVSHDVFTCGHDAFMVMPGLFICEAWLLRVWDMTLSCVCHNAFTCETWINHMCDMTYFTQTICVTWLMTQSLVGHDSFMCVTQLVIQMWVCDSSICMTHSYVSSWLIHMCGLTHMCDMPLVCDSFICETTSGVERAYSIC